MDDREIEDLMDQLDVFIALREFDEAVDSIKRRESAYSTIEFCRIYDHRLTRLFFCSQECNCWNTIGSYQNGGTSK